MGSRYPSAKYGVDATMSYMTCVPAGANSMLVTGTQPFWVKRSSPTLIWVTGTHPIVPAAVLTQRVWRGFASTLNGVPSLVWMTSILVVSTTVMDLTMETVYVPVVVS